MREQGMDVFFVIVGDGPERNNLKALALSLGIEDRVRFAGFRPNARDFLRIFDAFVLPSIHEGTPMALLEAMHEGIPCVATNVGGIPEILENGQCGIMVPPKSPTELARACGMVLQNGYQRDSLVKRAYERVLRHYDAEASANKVLNVYRVLSDSSIR
jgi:glycosyltransferase involved in cell wall biosynthesis